VGFDRLTVGFENYRFIHQALPELDLHAVDLTTRLFNKPLKAPVLISSMTGGTEQAQQINLNLAAAAQQYGVAMGLGSQRAGIVRPETRETFKVRHVAPDILLFANIGAVQFNYGFDVEHCYEAVEMIEADALILHLNPLQEAVQPEGNTHWKGLLHRIEQVCRAMRVPVIAKEVGFGISTDAARQLASAGVAAIDVAGAGGTSWSAVEAFRAPSPGLRTLAETFWDWGIPTAESIVQSKIGAPKIPIIASGGIRDGLEAAKCIALGAQLVGFASPMLKLANLGEEEVIAGIELIQAQMRVAMFGIGTADLDTLGKTKNLVKAER